MSLKIGYCYVHMLLPPVFMHPFFFTDCKEVIQFLNPAMDHSFSRVTRSVSNIFLAFSFLLGLLSSIGFSMNAGADFDSLMCRAASSSVSIVGLLAVSLFPFLLSAFAVLISLPELLLPICYGKAFCYGLVSMGVLRYFGSAGPLARMLLMFSNLAAIGLLYFFWQRYVSGENKPDLWELFTYFSLFLLIGSVDYCIVSPFWSVLI